MRATNALLLTVAFFWGALFSGCGSIRQDLEIIGGPESTPRQVMRANLRLRNAGSEHLRNGLIADLETVGAPKRRLSAVRLMAVLGGEQFRGALAATATGDPNEEVRAAAKEALVKLDSPLLVKRLVQNLYDDDFMVRATSARALGGIGHPAAFNALADRARNDDDWFVQVESIDAIGRLDIPAGRAWLATYASDATDADLAEVARAGHAP